AEPDVRTATALARAAVAPEAVGGGGGETAGEPGGEVGAGAALERAELWAYDGATGVVRRLAGAFGGGFRVAEELATGLTAERAVLAATPRGEAYLALASSPWRFYRIATAAGAADAAIQPLEVPGNWEGSLALVPTVDGVRAVGIVSHGIIDPTVAWATLREEGSSDVHLLPHVPVRTGSWLGYGRDGERRVMLIGGGADAQGGAHSDVYAVDLDAGGDTELIAPDDGGAPAIGADAWVTGERGTRGWTLRVVPARHDSDGSVRYGAYERRTAGRLDLGWRPAGASAHDTPRSDATLAHALEEGTSCELGDAKWYAPPGTWAYDDDPSHPVLRCEQRRPAAPAVTLLPRQVQAYALGERALWTVSQAGLERWSLSGAAPAVVQQLPVTLPGKPNARRVLAASDKLVALARGERLAVYAESGDSFAALGTLELHDDVVALHVGSSDIWFVGERRIHHARVAGGALALVGSFELVRYEGDVFARRLAANDDDEDEHGGGHGHDHGGDHGDDDEGGEVGKIVSASAHGPILALALEHDLVTLDLRQPGRLPTFGSRHFDAELDAVATDGRFVYLHLDGDETEGAWHTFRATNRGALEPSGHAPARGFAKQRQYAGRYAARLTGVALHLSVGSTP
ncbi:MAG: hypothetical protein IT373_02550, partial [Polyangiaceae bacterium]|nr:hypothetical protein [Polyangiaceae bacterium]